MLRLATLTACLVLLASCSGGADPILGVWFMDRDASLAASEPVVRAELMRSAGLSPDEQLEGEARDEFEKDLADKMMWLLHEYAHRMEYSADGTGIAGEDSEIGMAAPFEWSLEGTTLFVVQHSRPDTVDCRVADGEMRIDLGDRVLIYHRQ